MIYNYIMTVLFWNIFFSCWIVQKIMKFKLG